MAVFPPSRILLGDAAGPLLNLGTALAALAPTAGESANTVANGRDRRTFLLVRNASASARHIHIPFRYNVQTADALYFSRYSGAGVLFTPGIFMDIYLPAGALRALGPFDPQLFNDASDNVAFGFSIDTAGWGFHAGAVTSVQVAAFYLPDVSLVAAGPTQNAGVSPLSVTALNTIVPTGLDMTVVTFATHSDADGWNLTQRPANGLSNGDRRFVWLRNSTGADRTMGIHGSSRAFGMSSAGAQYTRWQDTFVVPHDANNWGVFVGPFPASFFVHDDNIDLWIAEDSGVFTSSQLTVTYLELPA